MQFNATLQGIFKEFSRISRSPTIFAFLFQGISGLIQLTAFISLRDSVYLDFSSAFLTGTVLSIVFVLNFENSILGGRFSSSTRLYFIIFWLLGMASVVIGKIIGLSSPHFIVYCCWGVCLRLLLAWAAKRQIRFGRLLFVGLVITAICLGGEMHYVMTACLLAMLLAAPAILSVPATSDEHIYVEVLNSGRAFIQYLPHTVSGLLLGYFDRFMALQVVGGVDAETYLRTIQICSWAAFICYPIVFGFRNRILSELRLTLRSAFSIVFVLSVIMTLGVSIIIFILIQLQRLQMPSLIVVALCIFAIVLSQLYQVASILNFVGKRFILINKITLISGGVSLIVGYFLVTSFPTALSLATVFFVGWLVQANLTVYYLCKNEGITKITNF